MKIWSLGFVIALLGYLLVDEKNAYLYGCFTGLVNIAVALGVYYLKRKQVPRYPAQALVIVISTTLMRFLIVGSLLVYGFTRIGLTPEPLLIGFVLGQIFFLIHQLVTVKIGYGK